MIKPIEDWVTLDARGVRMPLYTRPCLEILDKMDFVGKNVFEYGVGHSSAWYKSRGANVFGVDSNSEWVNLFRQKAGTHVVHTRDKESYISAIELFAREFDVVVIDGVFRDYCTEYALANLSKGGLLIIDNWKQPQVCEGWPVTEALFKEKALKVEVYKEEAHGLWQTAMVRV